MAASGAPGDLPGHYGGYGRPCFRVAVGGSCFRVAVGGSVQRVAVSDGFNTALDKAPTRPVCLRG